MKVFKIGAGIILLLFIVLAVMLHNHPTANVAPLYYFALPFMCAKLYMAYSFIKPHNNLTTKKVGQTNPHTFAPQIPCKEMVFQAQLQVFNDNSLEEYSRVHVYDSLIVLEFRRVKIHNSFTLEELQEGSKFKEFITYHLN